MKNIHAQWMKGRGKLAPFHPLLGEWIAETESPMGPVRCIRKFRLVLNDAYVQLDAEWHFGEKVYRELAMFGVGDSGNLEFWSFTSDKKKSNGILVEAPDVFANALAFQAEMPAGTARMVYWPDVEDGFHWAVESKTKKGWNRFTHHHYREFRTQSTD